MLYVGLYEFPQGETLYEGFSDQLTRSNEQTISMDIDIDEVRTDTKYFYSVGVAPPDISTANPDYERISNFMQTDPFVFESDGVTIQRKSFEEELEDDSGNNHERNNIEGSYHLQVEGRTAGKSWDVQLLAHKHAHAIASRRSRGRSRPEYVSYELTEGTANALASLLKQEANELGFSDFQAVEFVIDFVQALPYVPDDVSTGFDDYTKFIMETFPEMGGDCEDSAIMLASILEADEFNYDMILIQPPGHMAAGIWNSNPTGYHYELDGRTYEYIETTGEGWGQGDIPDIYRGERAYLHQV